MSARSSLHLSLFSSSVGSKSISSMPGFDIASSLATVSMRRSVVHKDLLENQRGPIKEHLYTNVEVGAISKNFHNDELGVEVSLCGVTKLVSSARVILLIAR